MKTSRTISVSGMQCSGCEENIESAVGILPGIFDVTADYPSGKVSVQFDTSKTSPKQILNCISDTGYTIQSAISTNRPRRFFKFSASVFSLAMIIAVMIWSRRLWEQSSLPQINSQTGNSMIFLVGLISGLHCVGMCGNFVLGYTTKDAEQNRSPYLSHILYSLGKSLSYALFGALFGFLGSLFKITPFISGVTAIIAGLFLVIFGLNVLNVFSILKRIRIKQPEAMAKFAFKQHKQSKNPFFIGFFSGFLLGCGPLQAMYVFAAGNGDALEGAKFLTLFGLGTLPALIGFGIMARLLSNKMTQRFIQASGVILIVMGLMMLNKGFLRTNSGFDFQTIQYVVLTKAGIIGPDEQSIFLHSNLHKAEKCH